MGVVFFFFQILSTVLCLYHLFVVAFVHLFCLGHGRGETEKFGLFTKYLAKSFTACATQKWFPLIS